MLFYFYCINEAKQFIPRMKKDKYINPAFPFLDSFVETLPKEFNKTGKTIRDKRNIVKIVNINGISVVVKSYHKLTLANRIIYSLFRKSKAQRAYENAEFLMQNGITTPIPAAYLDCYKNIMLKKSFFISLYIKSKPIKDLFENTPPEERNQALSEFASFTHKLHHLGIFHGDYSLANVLYTKINERYDFCLIDNNKMKFRKYTRNRAINNLKRIDLPLDSLAKLIQEYSKLQSSDPYTTTRDLLLFRESKKLISNLKRVLKILILKRKKQIVPK